MKINIGSGYTKFDGYINIDNDPNSQPDHLVDLEKDRLPFEDSTVERVIAHHILEHLGDGYFHLLRELYRVCKDKAIIDIVVPYHHHEVFYNDPTHKRPITVDGLRMFSKQYNLENIKMGVATSNLAIMHNVDFNILNYSFKIDPFYDDILSQNTEEQNHRLMREALNTAIEMNATLSVNKE